MFVIVGTKRKRERLGHAADFCPICREFRAMRITRQSQVPHLYYVPLGRGSPLLHERECLGCGVVTAAKEVVYEGYADEAPADIVDLAAATNPDIMETWRDRLALEERLEAGTLTPEERLSLIAEPIAALEFTFRQTAAAEQVPTMAGIGIIGAVILTPTAVFALTSGPGARGVAAILLGLAVGAVFVAIYGFWSGGVRAACARLMPILLRALRPLRPAREELERVFAELRLKGLTVAKRIRAEEVWSALEADLARGGT
jgi:hypothetical protein